MPSALEILKAQKTGKKPKTNSEGFSIMDTVIRAALPLGNVLPDAVVEPIRREADKWIPDVALRQSDVAAEIETQPDYAPNSALGILKGGDSKTRAAGIIRSQIDSGELKPNYFTGFVSSTLSSIPEMFGMRTPVESEVFRIQNPWSGFASQLIGAAGPYGAAFKISKLGTMSKALEAGVAGGTRFLGGASVTAAPIRSGMVREFLRFTPLELSRVGVGYAAFPVEERRDGLLWEVGTSMALNAAFGGVGGFVTGAGKARAARKFEKAATGHSGFLPTFELRNMKDIATQWTDDVVDKTSVIEKKVREVLTLRPGRGKGKDVNALGTSRYFQGLTDVADEDAAHLYNLFEPQGRNAKAEETATKGLDVRFLATGKPSDASKAPKEVVDGILSQLGWKDRSDIAANMVTPRAVTFTNNTTAGRFGKIFDKNSGITVVPEAGVAYAKEGDGLFTVFKVLKREPGTLQGKKFGQLGLRNGDTMLVGKTDRLDLFVPETHLRQERVVADWARLRSEYRPGLSSDPFNAVMDTVSAVSHGLDWEALAKSPLTKSGKIAYISAKLTDALKREGALPQAMGQADGTVLALGAKLLQGSGDSASIKRVSEGLWDVFAPTLQKELKNPIYARVNAMLEVVMRKADEFAETTISGIKTFKGTPFQAVRSGKWIGTKSRWDDLAVPEDVLRQLSPDELNQVVLASMSNDIEGTLKTLSESGQANQKVIDAVKLLQEVNERTIAQDIKPALEAAGVADKVKWLENHTGLPRIWRGEHFVDIKKGDSTVWRVTAKTGAEAERIGKVVVKEAEARGEKWEATPVNTFGDLSNVESAFDRLAEGLQVGSRGDKTVEEIIMSSMRRANAERRGIPKVRTPKGLTEDRSKLAGNYADEWTADEVIDALKNHSRMLNRFAANATWSKRWGQQLVELGELGSKAMQRDIERRAAQFAGIPGDLTAGINKVTSNIGLGNRPIQKIAEISSSLMYNLSLGILNPTFAVLNIVTPLMTTAPWISYMQTAPTWRQGRMMDALPKIGPDGKIAGVAHTLNPMKVMGQAYKMVWKADATEKAALERAVNDGTISAQTYESTFGPNSAVGANLRESWQAGGFWGYVGKLATAPAIKSENFSRMVAFNAAYVLGRDFFGLADEALYRFASRGTKQTMYGYALTDRPRILTGPIGGVVGLFKNWQFHYIAQMMEYAGLAKETGNFAPIAWGMGMTTMIGGLGATPAKTVVDGFVNMTTESKTSMEWLSKNWGNDPEDEGIIDWADVMYFGLPAVFGASLQSSASMPGTDIMQDATNLMNVVSLTRAGELAKAVSAMNEYGDMTGKSGMDNPELRAQFLGAVLPRALARLYAVSEEDTILSMRSGYPSVQGVSGTTRALYGLGFNQSEVDRFQIVGKEAYKETEKTRALIRSMGREMKLAIERDDRQTMQDVSDRAVMLGVDVSKVYSSANTRIERSEGDLLSRYGDDIISRYNLDRGGDMRLADTREVE